jgi:hypothetical protein
MFGAVHDVHAVPPLRQVQLEQGREWAIRFNDQDQQPPIFHELGGEREFPEKSLSRPRVSNPEPAVYKTAALPIELGRRDSVNATYAGRSWGGGRLSPAALCIR